MNSIFQRLSQLKTSALSDVSSSFQFLQIVRLISTISIGIILVKIGIAQNELSTYEWFLFLINSFSFFWSVGLKNAVLNFYPDLPESSKRKFTSSYHFLFIIITAFILLISFLLYKLNVVDFKGYYGFFIIYFFIHVTSSAVEMLMLVEKKARLMFWYSLLTYLSFPVFVIFGYLMKSDIIGAIQGLVAWGILRFFYFLYYGFRNGFHFNQQITIQFLVFAFPLILYLFLGASVEIVDGFLVEHYFTDQFAIYKYGARELPVNTIFITSYITAMIPAAVSQLYPTLEKIKLRLTSLMNWLFPLSILLLIFSKFLFSLVYSEDFLLSAQIFNIYLLIIIFRLLAPHIVFYAKKENNLLLIVAFFETIINISLSLLFLKIYGILGIAYATLAAYAFEKVALSILMWYKYKIPLHKLIQLKRFTVYSSLMILVFIVVQIVSFSS